MKSHLGPIGALSTDKPPFDDRLAQGDEFKNNVKAGLRWKHEVEGHFIARVPAI